MCVIPILLVKLVNYSEGKEVPLLLTTNGILKLAKYTLNASIVHWLISFVVSTPSTHVVINKYILPWIGPKWFMWILWLGIAGHFHA